jgi:hypothetical protein
MSDIPKETQVAFAELKTIIENMCRDKLEPGELTHKMVSEEFGIGIQKARRTMNKLVEDGKYTKELRIINGTVFRKAE